MEIGVPSIVVELMTVSKDVPNSTDVVVMPATRTGYRHQQRPPTTALHGYSLPQRFIVTQAVVYMRTTSVVSTTPIGNLAELGERRKIVLSVIVTMCSAVMCSRSGVVS